MPKENKENKESIDLKQLNEAFIELKKNLTLETKKVNYYTDWEGGVKYRYLNNSTFLIAHNLAIVEENMICITFFGMQFDNIYQYLESQKSKILLENQALVAASRIRVINRRSLSIAIISTAAIVVTTVLGIFNYLQQKEQNKFIRDHQESKIIVDSLVKPTEYIREVHHFVEFADGTIDTMEVWELRRELNK